MSASLGPAVVLVVDGDGVTRRYIEIVLGADRRFVIETATTATAALDLLRSIPCDLVITEARLPDLDGLELVRRIRQRPSGADVPILVLSADERVETKAAAFNAGADDYAVKPCARDELRARVARQVGRRSEERRQRREQAPLLSGELAALPLADLVAVLEMARRTATVDVHTDRGHGAVYFQAGRLVHASYVTVTGARAFYHLFADTTGYFQLHDGCDPVEHTIHESATALIMEAARLLDMSRAGRGELPGLMVAAPATETLAAASVTAAPTRDVALGFASDITDGYTLADASVRTLPELERWTRRACAGPRFQVVLIAAARCGAAAISSISTAPGERELLAALDPAPRCLTAEVRGRDGRTVDITLLDVAAAAPFVKALTWRPELCVVAPPGGDILQLGTAAREQIEMFLQVLRPRAVVAIGNRSLKARVAAALPPPPHQPLLGELLGDVARPTELRRAIVEGIRIWLSGGAR